MFEEVRALGRSGDQRPGGKRRRVDELLSSLGAGPAKQQRVPLRIRMGMLRAQTRRETRQREHSRESGVVLPTKTKTHPTKTKAHKRRAGEDGPGLGLPRGAVLRVRAPDR